MKLPTVFRAWQVIGTVSPWLMHAEAAARLFRQDSLPHRILRAASSADYSSRLALEVATRRFADSWPLVGSSFVLRALAKHGRIVVDTSLPDTEARVCLWDLGGHLIAHVHARGGYCVRSLTPEDELVRTVVTLMTADLGASRLYVNRDGLVADSDGFGDHVSEQARELIEDLRAELATGESCRTVLLVGPPGSGKSTMARQIAEAFADTTVAVDGIALAHGSHMIADHVDPGNSGSPRRDDVAGIVKHCGAQAVVVDDYDRRGSEGESLALIRDLRASARVVIFTANDPGAFSPAEQRRFNKLVRVTMLDRETARSIAPDLPESVRDEAWATLLAAYLHELAVLCRAGRIDPVVALAELQERQRAAEGPDAAPSSAR